MKVCFIGTSHGVPEMTRQWTSAFIDVGGRIYAIDAGAYLSDGIINTSRRLEDVKAVFITHRHGDHMNGLLPFVDIISWYFKESNPTIFFPDEGIAEALLSLRDSLYMSKGRELRTEVIKEGVFFDDGVLRATAIRTKHLSDGHSFSFLIEAEGKRVLFTGDMHSSVSDYPAVAYDEELDLTVCESAHFKLTERAEILKKTKTKSFVVSHYAPINYGEMDGFKAMMPFPVTLAEDGTEIEL